MQIKKMGFEIDRKDEDEDQVGAVNNNNNNNNKESTTTATNGGVNWLNLPGHLECSIADKLSCVKDQVFFGAVCRQWHRSFHAELRGMHARRHPVPLLMLPTSSDDGDETRSLYSLADKKLTRVPVPHLYCAGSTHGWLVMVTPQDFGVTLLNPFSNNEIQLPPLSAFPLAPLNDSIWSHYFLDKAVLSADPLSNPNNYVVLAIYGEFRRLAFFRSGDKAWTTLSSEIINVKDVIYYKDQFYATTANDYGQLWVCDLNNIQLTSVAPGPGCIFSSQRYLVELASTGELLQVLRQTDEEKNENEGFDVFKLDFERLEWIRMEDHLQECTLFVGANTSFSLFAPDYYNYGGDGTIEPNTIYFTDDYYDHHYSREMEKLPGNLQLDIGVFHLKDGRITPLCPVRCTKFIPNPIWIQKPIN